MEGPASGSDLFQLPVLFSEAADEDSVCVCVFPCHCLLKAKYIFLLEYWYLGTNQVEIDSFFF